MTNPSLEFTQRAGGLVARITLDNPRKLNIFTPGALSLLTERLKEAEQRKDLRAVVITGAGDTAFCGGADLAVLDSLDPTSARGFIGKVHGACAAVRDCPVPVVARVNGWCLGAGLELAAACDLRIASDSAHFGMPEVRLGIPSVVEAALLPRLVGVGRARWLMLTGESIDAKTAMAWGLIEKMCPLKELDLTVDAALDAILMNDPKAIRTQKLLCKLWEESPLEDSIRVSIDEFARTYETDEPSKRIAAFRSAKKPEKSG